MLPDLLPMLHGLRLLPRLRPAPGVAGDRAEVRGPVGGGAVRRHHPRHHLFPRVCELLIEEGLSDVIVFGGGIIPEDDRPALFSSGIKAIFGPGTPTTEILDFIDTASSMDDVGVGAKTDWHWQSTA